MIEKNRNGLLVPGHILKIIVEDPAAIEDTTKVPRIDENSNLLDMTLWLFRGYGQFFKENHVMGGDYNDESMLLPGIASYSNSRDSHISEALNRMQQSFSLEAKERYQKALAYTVAILDMNNPSMPHILSLRGHGKETLSIILNRQFTTTTPNSWRAPFDLAFGCCYSIAAQGMTDRNLCIETIHHLINNHSGFGLYYYRDAFKILIKINSENFSEYWHSLSIQIETFLEELRKEKPKAVAINHKTIADSVIECVSKEMVQEILLDQSYPEWLRTNIEARMTEQ